MTTQRIIERIEGITGTGGLIAALQHLQDRAEKADIHMIAAGEQYAGIALELVQDVDDGELTIEFRADP